MSAQEFYLEKILFRSVYLQPLPGPCYMLCSPLGLPWSQDEQTLPSASDGEVAGLPDWGGAGREEVASNSSGGRPEKTFDQVRCFLRIRGRRDGDKSLVKREGSEMGGLCREGACLSCMA